MMIKTSSGRDLIVTNISSFDSELSTELTPSIILVSAWSALGDCPNLVGSLVNFYLSKGAKYFVCIGSFSESLHDEIDELIYQYDDEQGSNISSYVVTTYHESIEDAVDYAIFATQLDSSNDECIIAVLDRSETKDQKLLKHLVNV